MVLKERYSRAQEFCEKRKLGQETTKIDKSVQFSSNWDGGGEGTDYLSYAESS